MMKSLIFIFAMFLTGSNLVVANAFALEEIFQLTPEERLSSKDLLLGLCDGSFSACHHERLVRWKRRY